MSASKTFALFFVAACAFTAPAFAEDMMMKDGTMMMVMPDGKMMNMPASDKTMSDMMMKDGKVMSGTHIMMMSGGKMYMMDDKKMSDGKMMSDHMMMKK